MKRNFLIVIFCLFISIPSFAQETITTVILVRHAEKSAAPADDPVLSAAGKVRSDLLVRMLEKAGITAIFTSQFARTRMTAEPLARKINVSIQTVDAAASKQLATTIRTKHAGRTVLVVGHSNTLPEIIHALGGPKMEELPETDYDNLFVLTLGTKTGARLMPLKFFSASNEQVCQ